MLASGSQTHLGAQHRTQRNITGATTPSLDLTVSSNSTVASSDTSSAAYFVAIEETLDPHAWKGASVLWSH